MRPMPTFALTLLAGLLTAAPVLGQTPQRPALDPDTPVLENPIPDKIEPRGEGDPPATGSTGGTLSERLEDSGGVLKPDTSVTPNMTVPAPVPNPGTTPVIPPPDVGTPK